MKKNIKMDSLKDAVKYFAGEWTDLPILAIKDGESNKNASQGTIIISNIDNELKELEELMESHKLGFCFYPNGSTQDVSVEEIRWHFVDIDKGDKETQLQRIKDAPLEPTIVYEGRAGYKMLYRVTNANWDTSSSERIQQSIAYFKNIQQQLVEFFDGDGSVINPANALRLPFVNNYKEWRLGKVYKEEVVKFNPNNIYTQKQIMDSFPSCSRKHLVKDISNSEETVKEMETINQLFTDYLESKGLKWIDRGDRLSFCCPIHEDHSPSAYMFKGSPMIFCSNGKAGGGCPIESGRTIDWLANHLDLEDLRKAWADFNACKEEKYLAVNLPSMFSKETVPLCSHSNTDEFSVKGVLESIESAMKQRGINVDEKTRQVYETTLSHAFAKSSNFLCVPLPPGGGKSTLMRELLKYQLQHNQSKAGAIIVVERIETAKELAKELGNYTLQLEGTGIDVSFYKEYQAAHVMESAFTSNLCEKELGEYRHGICRGCDQIKTCPIPKKYKIQKGYPIVILSHTRLVMDKDRLENYEHWIDANGRKHKRKLLIIDEKPLLVNIKSLTKREIKEFLLEIQDMAFDIGEVDSAQSKVNQLQGQINDLESVGGQLEPLDCNFLFDFKNIWYRKYTGQNVDLINQVERLIRDGGKVAKNQYGEIQIYTHQVNQFDFCNYNTILLDGTSSIDMDYRVNNNIGIFSIPRDIRIYEKLSFYTAPISMSKQMLSKDPSIIEKLVATIKQLAENEKVFVLCFKNYKSELISNLKHEISKGQVKINHYGNVKGSNNYADCTAMVIIGIQHKGDPFYISKYEAIYGKTVDNSTVTINGVRRFKDVELERVKQNDQLVGLIQDIARTKIRNKDNREIVRVFIPIKDKVFINLLHEYFIGCTVKEWDIVESSLPSWISDTRLLFDSLEAEEKINKGTIKNKLNLTGEAGKKKFQRIQRDNRYKELLESFNIISLNNRTYIKQEQ